MINCTNRKINMVIGGSYLNIISNRLYQQIKVIDARVSYYTLVQCHRTKLNSINEAAIWWEHKLQYQYQLRFTYNYWNIFPSN